VDKKRYKKLTEKASPNSPILKNMFFAFLIGGAICALGQIFMNIYIYLGVEKDTAGTLVSITLILISVILTGLNLFDRIAKIAGAGTLVPITGFANSVASPAIEFKSEGFVLGMAAKMFIISGPVIVYGTVASVIYGIIYWICQII
jgi:stage V sporulation protein AC